MRLKRTENNISCVPVSLCVSTFVWVRVCLAVFLCFSLRVKPRVLNGVCCGTAKQPHANARIVDVIVVGVGADARHTHTHIIIKYLCHVSFYALILFKWIICHLWPNKDFVSLSLSCNSIIHCCDTAATATAAGVSADRFIFWVLFSPVCVSFLTRLQQHIAVGWSERKNVRLFF